MDVLQLLGRADLGGVVADQGQLLHRGEERRERTFAAVPAGLFAPLVPISGFLFCLGSFSLPSRPGTLADAAPRGLLVTDFLGALFGFGSGLLVLGLLLKLGSFLAQFGSALL